MCRFSIKIHSRFQIHSFNIRNIHLKVLYATLCAKTTRTPVLIYNDLSWNIRVIRY